MTYTRGAAIAVPLIILLEEGFRKISSVNGESMQPVLNPARTYNGKKQSDWILMRSVKNYQVDRGDIVVLRSPRKADEWIIKRVIAIEGDVLKTKRYRREYVKIPKGHIWIEGDNHVKSLDSNQLGPVPLGLLEARASHVIWPISRWQRLHSQLPEGRAPIAAPPRDLHLAQDQQHKLMSTLVELEEVDE